MRKHQRDAGFSLVELLTAMTVTTVATGMALTAITNVSGMREASTLMADGNQSLRTTLNLMTRDLLVAGRDVPVGGIPIPSGAGSVALVRPSPDGTAMTFPAANVTLPAVSPGDGLGPGFNGTPTDMITLLMIDTSRLCDSTLMLQDRFLVNIAVDGTSAQVDPAVPIGCANGIGPGDIIMFKNAVGEAMQMVTGVVGQTLQFANGDPMRLNQAGAAAGTILQIKDGAGNYPQTKASRVLMVSYYVDMSVPDRPQLMRRLNLREDRAIGLGIENVQITYDLVDGVANPVNVASPAGANSPHQIRKANVFVAGRSRRQWTRSRQFLRTTLSTQVSLRSLSFVDRYNPS